MICLDRFLNCVIMTFLFKQYVQWDVEEKENPHDKIVFVRGKVESSF